VVVSVPRAAKLVHGEVGDRDRLFAVGTHFCIRVYRRPCVQQFEEGDHDNNRIIIIIIITLIIANINNNVLEAEYLV
jgi:hypothetical protein